MRSCTKFYEFSCPEKSRDHQLSKNRQKRGTTQLLENRQAVDADSQKSEYLTECGLELLQDKTHAYIKNWALLA